jgi:hypothetical protein
MGDDVFKVRISFLIKKKKTFQVLSQLVQQFHKKSLKCKKNVDGQMTDAK